MNLIFDITAYIACMWNGIETMSFTTLVSNG